jgi:hypothetical protein
MTRVRTAFGAEFTGAEVFLNSLTYGLPPVADAADKLLVARSVTGYCHGCIVNSLGADEKSSRRAYVGAMICRRRGGIRRGR